MAGEPYVVVVGGANMDICGRPLGPLVARDSNLGTVRVSPGGVGRNIAHNLALLGVPVRFVTCFGRDVLADSLVRSCAEAGMDVSHALTVADGATSTYLYVTDTAGEMQVAINDMSLLDALTPARLAERVDLLQGAAVVVADANLPEASLTWLAEHVEVPLFCDPISTAKATRVAGALGKLHTLKPNKLQAEALSGVKVSDDASLRAAAETLLGTGLARAFVSLGAEGVLCADHGHAVCLPCLPGRKINTTGAGDAMMAGLVWAHLQGLELADAGCAGLAAAAIACEAEFAVNPALSEKELLARMKVSS